jgi:signal transduction histidine kinase/ligand-binding sensor domain-containing protein
MTLLTIENVEPNINKPSTFKRNIFWYLACFIALFAFASCHHSSENGKETASENAYQPPIVKPLAFSNERKINFSEASTKPYTPTTQNFDLTKLNTVSYADTGNSGSIIAVDSSVFANFSRLPKRSFDIDKLPSKPLVFQTVALKAPKFIKAGDPRPSGNPQVSLYGLTDAQGLDGLITSCLYTDHNGFLWIATDKGIYKYDGQTLIRYINDPLRTVFCMTEDDLGNIWMGSVKDGLAMFDPKTGQYGVITTKQGLVKNRVFRLVTDKDGHIWVDCFDGVNVINPKTKTITTINVADGLSKGNYGDIVKDHQQKIWIACEAGFDIVDLDNKTISHISSLRAMRSARTDAMFCDSRNNIWLTSQRDGLLGMIDTRKNQLMVFDSIPKKNNGVSTFSEDSRGNIWYSRFNGIMVINPEKHTFSYMNALGDGDAIVSTISDKSGDTWIGATTGLFVYRQNKLLVQHLGDKIVASVAEDKNGIIYTGCNDGVRIYDPKNRSYWLLNSQNGLVNDTVQNITIQNNQVFIASNGGLNIIDSARHHIETFTGSKWYAVTTDKAGKLWICANDGIYIYDPLKKTITHLGQENDIGNLSDIMPDNNGNLWASGPDGVLNIINPEHGTIKDLDFHLPLNNTSYVMLHDPKNRWIGTTKGIFIVDEHKNTITRISMAQGLADETVISLLKHGNVIYAGTDKGISAIIQPGQDDNNWHITSFGKEFGLRKINTGYWMSDNIAHNGNYIWGDNGISVLNIESDLARTEPDVYINGISMTDEPVYFTTPVKGSDNSVNQFNVKGKVLGPYNLPADLELPHDNSNLQFTFTSRSRFKADTTWYRYMLTGADKTWRKQTNETTSGNYFNLPAGNYTFKVEAIASDGTWSKPAIFNFTVLPPWWQTWWARVIILLLLLAGVRFLFNYRSRSLIRSKKLLEQKVAIRTQEVLEQKEELAAQRDNLEQAFSELKQTQSQLIQSEKMASLGELTAGIAHEIQNPLNFVNNFSEVNTELIDELHEEIEKGNFDEVKAIATDIQENEKKINMHGKRADAIVKGMLQHSRAGSGLKEPTDINKLADEYLRLSYHGLRAKDKSFNAEMVTRYDEKLPLVNLLPQEMGRVLLNMFNNAFYAVHQKQKTAGGDYKPAVEITTLHDGSSVTIQVKDNGMGIPDAVKDKIMQPFFTTKPTGEGTGLGLSLSYDIVVKGHGGTITVDSKEGEFTEFIINLPLK